MSNKQIETLTVRLLQALDKNYDVVNMEEVLSVIAALESTKITKEQLEATRLAKYINLFRRRTKSEQLAKRAKSLLKRWREMVGMPLGRPLGGSCSDLMRNESATSSNFHESINLIESCDAPAVHPQQQTFDISLNAVTSRTALSNSSISAGGGKPLETYKNIGKVPMKTAPTSFSNVLAGFSGSGIAADRNNPNFLNVTANGPSCRRKNFNLKQNIDGGSTTTTTFSESFSFDQQSTNLLPLGNNNLLVPDSTKFSASTEPIIIDIEDSNSGSNLIQPTSYAPPKESELITTTTTNSNKEIADQQTKAANKANKKTKKDKKRTREQRDSFQDQTTPSSVVVIDAESSLSQQSNLRKQQQANPTSMEKFSTSFLDDKSRCDNLIVTNISEILSLSNSSMSSVFPTSSVGATKNLFSQQSNRQLSESDLSFAGKFAQESGKFISTSGSGGGGGVAASTTMVMNYNNEPAVNKPTSATTAAVSCTTNAFQPFTGIESECNSHDSASQSRHSTFEIINNSQGGGNKSSQQQKHPEAADISFYTHRSKSTSNKEGQPSAAAAVAETIQQPQVNVNSNAKINPTTTTTTTQQHVTEQKVPKKRGRKKGSKGVDSLIAKDTTLSSQMLIQSLGNGAKKVKTTKELYAEMQNRKLGVSTPTTPSQWTNSQSQQTFVRRVSFCSEPSLHSPRTFDASSINATVSTVATRRSTPEKGLGQNYTVDIDSGSDSLISGGQSRDSVTIASIPERADNLFNVPSSKVAASGELQQKQNDNKPKVENKLRELIEKLPEVPSIEKIEIDTTKDVVPCTCKIIEISPKQAQDHQDADADALSTVGNLLSLDALKNSTAASELLKNDNDEHHHVITINVCNNANDDDAKPSTSRADVAAAAAADEPAIKTETKRSIFDLDFDDDEDPLHSLIAEVTAAGAAAGECKDEDEITSSNISETATSPSPNNNNKIADNVGKMENMEIEIEQSEDLRDQPALPPAIDDRPFLPPLLPTYKVEEDEACLAKQRFELQVQKITNFHIRSLHNFYIPNVNGNWDDNAVIRDSGGGGSGGKSDNSDAAGLLSDGSNVVPEYCSFDSKEYIKKDLRNIRFDQNFKSKLRSKAVGELLYDTPFLGVARCLKNVKSSHRKTRKHRQKIEPKAKAEEETTEVNLLVTHHNIVTSEGSNEDQQCAEIAVEAAAAAAASNLLSSLNTVTLSDSETQQQQRNSINQNCNPAPAPPNIVFDEITINIDRTTTVPPPLLKNENSSSAGTPHSSLLAIVGNVNFNNNQIENTIEENEAAAIEKISRFHQDDIVSVVEANVVEDVDEKEEEGYRRRGNRSSSFSSDRGDIRNNNNCNYKDQKSEDSSCESHSSLKQTQKSINQKLRQHRQQQVNSQQSPAETISSKSYSKRKRRRKKSANLHRGKRQKIKCIKIAINGGIATQRLIEIDNLSDDDTMNDENDESDIESYISGTDDGDGGGHGGGDTDDNDDDSGDSESCADDDKNFEWRLTKDTAAAAGSDTEYIDEEDYEDDLEEEDEFSGDFHEVVTRDISPSSESGNNHIVLTIKKTPSKLNSPSGCSLPPISPIVTGSSGSGSKLQDSKTSPTPIIVEKIVEKNEEEMKTANGGSSISQIEIEDAAAAAAPTNKCENVKETENETPLPPSSSPPPPPTSHTQKTHSTESNLKKFNVLSYANLLQKFKEKNTVLKRRKRRLCMRRKSSRGEHKPFRFPDDIKQSSSSSSKPVFKKKHQKLFFPHEIFETNMDDGCNYPIFNMSSCESSCDELTDNYESERISSDKESPDHPDKIKTMDYTIEIMNENLSSESENCSDNSSKDDDNIFLNENLSDKELLRGGGGGGVIKTADGYNENQEDMEEDQQRSVVEFKETPADTEVLPEENNGLLVSFNNISSSALECCWSFDSVMQQHAKECDEKSFGKEMSGEESGFMLDNIAKAEIMNKKTEIDFQNKVKEVKSPAEYSSGMRTISKEVNNDNDDGDGNGNGNGNENSRLQQFKEWHQLLQLKSYNDEFITVLPYVVLD